MTCSAQERAAGQGPSFSFHSWTADLLNLPPSPCPTATPLPPGHSTRGLEPPGEGGEAGDPQQPGGRQEFQGPQYPEAALKGEEHVYIPGEEDQGP